MNVLRGISSGGPPFHLEGCGLRHGGVRVQVPRHRRRVRRVLPVAGDARDDPLRGLPRGGVRTGHPFGAGRAGAGRGRCDVGRDPDPGALVPEDAPFHGDEGCRRFRQQEARGQGREAAVLFVQGTGGEGLQPQSGPHRRPVHGVRRVRADRRHPHRGGPGHGGRGQPGHRQVAGGRRVPRGPHRGPFPRMSG